MREPGVPLSETVKAMLSLAAEEAHASGNGSFRDVCLGLQAGATLVLVDHEAKLLKLELRFADNAFEVGDVEVTTEPLEGYNVEGLHFTLYSLATPRFTPYGKDPLRIRRVVVGFGRDPEVHYDASFDNGLPMALNRAYNAERTMQVSQGKRQHEPAQA